VRWIPAKTLQTQLGCVRVISVWTDGSRLVIATDFRVCAPQGLARCRAITPTVLQSFSKEIQVPSVANLLSTDSLVRLLWSLASPAQLSSTTAKPTSLAIEIQATLRKAGKYITTQELEGRPGLLALFNDESYLAGIQHIVTTINQRRVSSPGSFKPSDLATVAWALASVGFRDDVLFHSAFPSPDDEIAWSAIPTEVLKGLRVRSDAIL
jgi:hypothetical protein